MKINLYLVDKGNLFSLDLQMRFVWCIDSTLPYDVIIPNLWEIQFWTN